MRRYTGDFNSDLSHGREFRTLNATAEDAIAMLNGAGYTVRYGKQILGYFSSQREAVFEAGRQGATAYKLVRQGDYRSPTHVVLVPVEETQQLQTPAELIAEKIRDQIGAGDAPLSPLAKQRVVMMLFNFCKDKNIAGDSFHILYPAALTEQFNRLWSNLEHEEKPQPTSLDAFMDFASARDCQEVAKTILDENVDACVAACSKKHLSEKQFEDLYVNGALRSGCIKENQDFLNSVLRHLARESVERRIDGDILRMLRREPSLRAMAASGNEEGIVDFLTSNGYTRREADEACSEIISVGKFVNKI